MINTVLVPSYTEGRAPIFFVSAEMYCIFPIGAKKFRAHASAQIFLSRSNLMRLKFHVHIVSSLTMFDQKFYRDFSGKYGFSKLKISDLKALTNQKSLKKFCGDKVAQDLHF